MRNRVKIFGTALALFIVAGLLSVRSSAVLWAQDGPPGSSSQVPSGPPGSNPSFRDDGPPGSGPAVINDGPPGSGGYTNRSYFIEEFYRIERTFISADRTYREAPGGSYTESSADYDRRTAYNNGLALLTRIGEVNDTDSQALERFAKDMNDKYQRAPSNSLLESLYDQARRAAWPEVVQRTEAELRNSDWRTIVDEAAQFDKRYQAAPSNSLEESTYNQLRSYAWPLAADYVSRDVSRQDYGTLRRLEAEFDNGYRAAPSNSASETFYRRALQSVRDRLN
jgi:hypothetical protein